MKACPPSEDRIVIRSSPPGGPGRERECAEAFNLFNRANFGLPVINMFTSTGALQPSTGLITYTATTARQLQFGLKVIW